MKKTIKFEHSADEDVVNHAYLEIELSKLKGNIPFMEKDYFDFEDVERSNEQSDEECSNEKAVKTTIKKLYDKNSSIDMIMRMKY